MDTSPLEDGFQFETFRVLGADLGWSGEGEFSHEFDVTSLEGGVLEPEVVTFSTIFGDIPFVQGKVDFEASFFRLTLQDEIPPEVSCDFNANGTVDFPDFLLFASAFGSTVESTGSEFDKDRNRLVDFADFLIFAEHFGTSGIESLAVPEPTYDANVIVSLIFLGGLASRGSQRTKRLPNCL